MSAEAEHEEASWFWHSSPAAFFFFYLHSIQTPPDQTKERSPLGMKMNISFKQNLDFHQIPYYQFSAGSIQWKWILWFGKLSTRSQHELNHNRKKWKLKKNKIKYPATASLTFNSPKHPCFTASGYCLSQSVPWDAGVMGPVDWRERDVIPLSPLSCSSTSTCADLWPPCWVTSV